MRGRRLLVAAPLALTLVHGNAAADTQSGAALRLARAPAAQLVPLDTVTLPGGTVVRRFQQVTGGVEVLDAQAIVTDAPGAVARLVADSTAPALRAPPRARVSRRSAVRIALASVAPATVDGVLRARLVVVPRDGAALAWNVSVPTRWPDADFEVLVDARSGAVLARRDLLRSRTGEAKLYDPNPVVEQGGDAGLHDNQDADSRLLTELRAPVKLRRLRGDRGCLVGRWAHVLLGPGDNKVCKRSLRWRSVTRSQARFEALEAYYQVDRAQKYIHGLGFSDSNGNDGAGDKRITVRADAIPDDNSFFRPSQDDITFGTGGVDDAEDADVIWHEYGHAVQDDQVPGFGRSKDAAAMGEGFGDYLSAAMTAETPGTNETDSICIFDWDGLTWGKISIGGRTCGRRANDQRTIGQARFSCGVPSGIHCLGQVWSSALWDLRQALGNDGQGRSVMDRVVIASHFMLTARARYADGANALLDADQALYGGAHQGQINNEMQGRGFL